MIGEIFTAIMAFAVIVAGFGGITLALSRRWLLRQMRRQETDIVCNLLLRESSPFKTPEEVEAIACKLDAIGDAWDALGRQDRGNHSRFMADWARSIAWSRRRRLKEKGF